MDRREFLKGSVATAAVAAFGGALPALARTDEFAALDGMAQADLVRRGDVTPLELVDAAISRIERLNPKLNAVVFTRFEKVRDEAQAGNIPDGPFKGVPYLIKDLSALEGEPLTYGARLFETNVAKADDGDTISAKQAGFLMVGKSNTPEFGLLPTTESILLGDAANPWDTNYHTGGSSGGAAAAVAAGIVPCANAGDGGGSIRIPASACGLVGLKTSRGRLSGDPVRSLPVSLSVRMGVSRTVRDTAQLLNVSEKKGDDATLPPVGFVEGPSSRRLKIAFYTGAEDIEADSEVKPLIEETAQLCEDLGHDIIPSALPFSADEMEEHFMALWSGATVPIVKNARLISLRQWRLMGAKRGLEPWTIGLAEHFEKREKENPGQLARAADYFKQIENMYKDYFNQFDVVLTPVLRKPPTKLGEFSADLGFDELYARTMDYSVYTGQYNGAGNCAISLPLGWTASGLPVGSQFAARTGDERTLLELAYELEEAKPWADKWAPCSAVNQ